MALRVEEFISTNEISEVHHGDCIGADEAIHNICCENYKIVIHPPNNPSMRAFCYSECILYEKDYLDRNKNIVDKTDMLIAFPGSTEVKRSGTWATVRYARKKNKRIILIYGNGQFVDET